MLGNLFYRGQNIEALNRATFGELRYWNEWHEIINKKTKDTTDQIENNAR
jgi:hypothetical protein